MGIDQPTIAVVVVAPHLLQQLLPRQHQIQMAGKVDEQQEFRLRQSETLGPLGNVTFTDPDLKLSDSDGLGLGPMRRL